MALELVHTAPAAPSKPRLDHAVIALSITEGARVLDVGCGDGALIAQLAADRGARVRGLELDPAKVRSCVARGLSVVQGDAERDLDLFPSASFDYVVFNDVLLKLKEPRAALRAAARIGEQVIVSIDNAAHWRHRLRLLNQGRLARWEGDAQCSIRDFAALARDLRLTIERATPISGESPGAPFAKTLWRANWFAEKAVFVLRP